MCEYTDKISFKFKNKKNFSILNLFFGLILFKVINGSSGIKRKHSLSTIISKFENLDRYSLLSTFDTLGFEELLYLADQNSTFREIIIQHYAISKFRIHEKHLQIKILPTTPNMKNIELNRFNSRIIRIHDAATALRFLRNFGQFISHISFYKSYAETFWDQRIYSFINKYCSNSLEELNGYFIENHSIDGWRKPFKKLTNIHLYELSLKCEDNMNLSVILPSLHSLYIKSAILSSLKCFEHHFSHLENIHLDMNSHRLSKNEKKLEKFFDLNPQIRSVQVRCIENLQFLHLISRKLKNIENLEISMLLNADNEANNKKIKSIHLKSVKKCSLQIATAKNLPISFDELEELEIRINLISNEFIRFIASQQTLRVLYIFPCILDLQQWMMLVENMPNLIEIKTQWTSDRENDGLISLMEKEINVKRITILWILKKNLAILRSLVNSTEWQIEGETEGTLQNVTFIRSVSRDAKH